MIAEFSAAFSAGKAAIDLIKTAQEGSSQVKLHDVALPLQQHIIDLQCRVSEAQAKYDDLANRNRELREALDKENRWTEVTAKYEHKVVASGMHLYGLKKQFECAEPFHWICPRCYENNKKSILQPRYSGASSLECGCGFTAETQIHEHRPVATRLRPRDRSIYL